MSVIKEQNEENKIPTRLIPVPLWNKFHQWPPIGGLRHLIFNAHYNGFSNVIRRAGRRVLIDEQEFFKWVEKQNPPKENK
jgi:hypothetical protein